MEPGLHLVHKPVGVTSFSLVQQAMARLEGRRPRVPVCHGGTLDPFAEGLMLLLVGQTTRLMDLFHTVPKVYVARIAWGVETDNGDLHGKPVAVGAPPEFLPPLDRPVKALEPADTRAVLDRFLGWHPQVPPATSAKKIGGEPAYKKAHRGEAVVLPASQVFLHEARFLEHDLPRSSLLWMRCKGGFYVRSLARDLGRALGCGAHVQSLIRTEIGPWQSPEPGTERWIHGAELLPWLQLRALTDREFEAIRQGRPVSAEGVVEGGWSAPTSYPVPEGPVRAMHEGRLVALLERTEAGLHPIANLRGGL
jgi:tRNA pseudouridine55 synthase